MGDPALLAEQRQLFADAAARHPSETSGDITVSDIENTATEDVYEVPNAYTTIIGFKDNNT
jgi:hypothetical protein